MYRSTPRFLIAVLLMLPLLGGVSVAGASAQGSGASVEIHKRTCPVGYSDNRFFEDCHDNPTSDVTFELGSLRDTTGPDGNVLFFELNEGTYTITESVPGEFAEKVIFCSFGGDPREPAAFDYVAGGIRLSVPANAEIVCDWYNVPYNLRGTPGDGDAAPGDGAAVTMHARLCPPGYTGNEPFETCHDNPLTGATFNLDGLSATTGEDGNTIFYQLNPGTYTVTQPGAGSFWFFSVFCSPEQDIEQDVPVTYVDNGFRIELAADQRVICDWYAIPHDRNGQPGDGDPDGPGTLTIHKLECPAGYQGQAFFEDCHDDRLEGVGFDVFGPEGLFEQGIQTDSDGVLTIDNIEVGGTVNVYELFDTIDQPVSVYVVYCSDASGSRVQFDYVERENQTGIRLSVFRGEDVLCDWYNIPAA